MTANQILEAIALKLNRLYPDRSVVIDAMPVSTVGKIYVHCTDQSHKRGLARRYSRSYSFQVQFFETKKDHIQFNAWAETMYFEFERLEVNECMVRASNTRAKEGENAVYHFTFDVKYHGLLKPTDTGQASDEIMSNLYPTEVLA